LYADGSTEEELADMIGVHPVRMPAILELAMKEIRARERERAAAVYSAGARASRIGDSRERTDRGDPLSGLRRRRAGADLLPEVRAMD